MPPRISVFPKCYFDELTSGRRSFEAWIRDAATLGCDGIEHYDGFFRSLAAEDVDLIARVLEETGQITSMICFSPDFTHPDADERRRQVERQKAAIDLTVRLGARHCRTLSGQRYPGLSRAEGVARTLDGLRRSLEYAERRGVILCMENHYKDGRWRFPEFAQAEDLFLEIVEQVDSPFFGVQYDPSNAIVGGYDPIRFLDRVRHRVVTMHASDRYFGPGDVLQHGEIGTGSNDYDAIFRMLADVDFSGWISIEDGMNGLDELRRSAAFLRDKRARYFGTSGSVVASPS